MDKLKTSLFNTNVFFRNHVKKDDNMRKLVYMASMSTVFDGNPNMRLIVLACGRNSVYLTSCVLV